MQRSVDASEFEATVGGHNSHVSFAVLVVVSLGALEGKLSERPTTLALLNCALQRGRLHSMTHFDFRIPFHASLLVKIDGGSVLWFRVANLASYCVINDQPVV